jgi:choline dehydrogenase
MTEQKVFDYIIVGAGSAGCVLAGRLSEYPDIRVLLLEQGPPNSSWTVRMPAGLRENFKPGRRYMRWYPTLPQAGLNNRIINHPRGIGLGGSSLVNGMVYLRGHRLDYDRWHSEGAEGWHYGNVLPYFKRMESFRGGSDHFRGRTGPVGVRRPDLLHELNEAFLKAGEQAGYPFTDDVNGAEQEGFCRFDMNVDRGYRSSSARAYLQKRRTNPNLKILSGATVLRLLVEHKRAKAVEFVTQGQKQKVFAEREIILSAGAIGSPQLLMLSGIGPAQHLKSLGISPVHDLPGVGKNLQDHLELDLQWHCKLPITINNLLKPHKMAMIGAQWLLFKTGLGAVNQCHVGAFVRSNMELDHPNIQFHFFPLCFNGWVPRTDISGFRVGAGPMRPTSRGSLLLRSADPSEPPQLDPKYVSTEGDLRELLEAYKVLQGVVAQPAFDRYRGPPIEPQAMPSNRNEIVELTRRLAASGFHLCGTCKMGRGSDGEAVVDPSTRVRGIDGLRVVDGSIIPSIVSCNLNAPIMMIAERAADIILEKPLLSTEGQAFRQRKSRGASVSTTTASNAD